MSYDYFIKNFKNTLFVFIYSETVGKKTTDKAK